VYIQVYLQLYLHVYLQLSKSTYKCPSVLTSVQVYLQVYLPSRQIPALDDGGELPKVGHLAGLLPAHLHRLDQISQVDLCQVSQPKPVDVPVIHPLAELQAQHQMLDAIVSVMTQIKCKIPLAQLQAQQQTLGAIVA